MTSNKEQDSNGNEPVVAGSESRLSKKLSVLQLLLVVIVVIAAIDVGILIYHSVNHKKLTTSSVGVSLSPAEVTISSSGFVPATINVKVGQGVIWTNDSSANHEVASDPYPKNNALGGFDEKQPLIPGDSFSFVFNKAGTYTYHDNLNPYTIKGTVIVK